VLLRWHARADGMGLGPGLKVVSTPRISKGPAGRRRPLAEGISLEARKCISWSKGADDTKLNMHVFNTVELLM